MLTLQILSRFVHINTGIRPNITATRPIQINLVEQGQKKGWNAVTAEVHALSTTWQSVEDIKKTWQLAHFFISVDKIFQ